MNNEFILVEKLRDHVGGCVIPDQSRLLDQGVQRLVFEKGDQCCLVWSRKIEVWEDSLLSMLGFFHHLSNAVVVRNGVAGGVRFTLELSNNLIQDDAGDVVDCISIQVIDQ